MPKSIQKQLQDAIDSGNLDLAKQLVAKMALDEKNNKVKKPRKKKEKQLIVVENATEEILDMTGAGDDINTLNEEDVVDLTNVSIKGDKDVKGMPCHVESILRPRKNTFKDDKTVASEDLMKNNKELQKLYKPALKRKKPINKRVQHRAKVKCIECNKIEIIPIDMAPNISAGATYKCNNCIINKRRS